MFTNSKIEVHFTEKRFLKEQGNKDIHFKLGQTKLFQKY